MIKLVFIIIATGLYILFVYLRKRNLSRKKYRLPDEIKSKYRKISVPTVNMEILANEYYEENIEAGYDKVKAIDALYDSNRNYSQVHKFASVIVYYYLAMGKKYRFRSETIDSSPDEIEKRLKEKGIIDIYFDEKNLEHHYFDLSFLAQ